MKKFFKILGITLGSILGLVMVVAAVAVWCVFTPERITPVARKVADKFITCEWEMGDVELTFFSTFPEFGLKINGLYLVNPMAGAQSDTVLTAPSVVAKLNVMAYLKHNNLVIRELSLPDMTANVYIDPEGACNANVFYTTPDTVEKDTSAFSLPFDSIVVNSCDLSAQHITFVDKKDSISAALAQSEIALNMAYWDDIRLRSQLNIEHFELKNVQYAHNATLRLDIPAEWDMETMHIVLHEAQVAVNEFELSLDGQLTIGDSIPMDVRLTTGQWQIQPLLSLLPKSITSSLKDIDVDGVLSLDATATGMYAEKQMPLIDAHVQLDEGHGKYAALPYTFSLLSLNADAHLDMNRPVNSAVTIHQLCANTLDSKVQLSGTVQDLMGKMQTNAHIDMDAPIADWAYFIPENLNTQGHIKGGLDVTATVAEVINNRLNSITARGTIHVDDFTFRMDSLLAELGQGDLQLNATLKDWPVLNAEVALVSEKNLHVAADSLDAIISAPDLSANAKMDTKDTTQTPTFAGTLKWKHLKGYYTSYSGEIGASSLDAKMTNSRRNQSSPVFSATLASDHIDAKAGNNHVTTRRLNLDAKSFYRKGSENFLLTWNPVLKFSLDGAEADIEGFEKHVSIPQIVFNYSNRDFEILNSSVILGHSDFNLTGNIHKIGKWLAKKDVLSGELNFTSNHTDVNELLELFSADSGSEETQTQTKTQTKTKTDTTSSEPFLVPADVDLTLNTNIKEAAVFDQVAHNLGGKIYVKNGVMVLEEIGFVCDAAKLQLTAMYRTPRRNHIYVGLDYHMLDVKIDQLISMIPQMDSMMPMLKTFKGDLEFHLACETYLKADYSIKTSTLRGACSIFGKDLVLLDSETFDKISKILSFRKKTENKVDSISAEITLYKNEVDIYPFCVSIDNYMAALGGRHNLDMSFDYHINLLSPIYLGVDVKGTLDDLSIKPAACIYAKDFRPIIHKNVDSQNMILRQNIRNSLRKNVKIQ